MTRPSQGVLCVLVGGLAASLGGRAGVSAAAPKDPKSGSSCFEEGRAYADENVTVSAPNGAHVRSAEACQEECAAVPACGFFTFYAGRGHTQGACWLLGRGSAARPDAAALSGPRDCAAPAAGWVESLTGTVGGTLGAATGAAAASHGATSGLAWWAWCSIALVVAAAGVGTASALGYAPQALLVPLVGKSRGAKIGPDEDDEEDDDELAAAGAAAPAAAAAPTHSVPLPTYSTASYSALPTAAPPLPMAQVTPRGSTQARPSAVPRESFQAGAARPHAPGGLLGGQSFAAQPMMGGFAGAPSPQSFAGAPSPQSFAGVPHPQSFAGPPQQQSFSMNH